MMTMVKYGTPGAFKKGDIMRFQVGDKIKVVNCYRGGEFDDGDIVTVERIGDEYGEDMNCYGCISPHDGYMWYLYDDEVSAVTKADNIRHMTDEELAAELARIIMLTCKAVLDNTEWEPTEEQMAKYKQVMLDELQSPF